MATGDQITEAITGKDLLIGLNECKGVVARVAYAVYGAWQNDDVEGKFTGSSGLADACAFAGTSTQTAVWNFNMKDPEHHFVVMPFKGSNSIRYSVLMAYAGQYTLKNYIAGKSGAPDKGGKGYKERWDGHELQQMLNTLVKDSAERKNYFGVAGTKSRIKYYKYPPIALNTALTNIGNYNLQLP